MVFLIFVFRAGAHAHTHTHTHTHTCTYKYLNMNIYSHRISIHIFRDNNLVRKLDSQTESSLEIYSMVRNSPICCVLTYWCFYHVGLICLLFTNYWPAEHLVNFSILDDCCLLRSGPGSVLDWASMKFSRM